ncbi:hypothetical protein BBJ28_00006263 [Nothophytophthora sp. Chile5]|nr:hypothetical protein BBJ28_00006263 [Nothophytophthora sp. Chile5]
MRTLVAPDVGVTSLSPSPSPQASPSRGGAFRGRLRPTSARAMQTAASDSWLPPINHLMSIPGRFLSSRIAATSSGESSPSSGSGLSASGRSRLLGGGASSNYFGASTSNSVLDRILNEPDDEWSLDQPIMAPQFVFPAMLGSASRGSTMRQQPEEIDLTVSSSESDQDDDDDDDDDDDEEEEEEGYRAGGVRLRSAGGGGDDDDDVVEILGSTRTPSPPLRRKRRRLPPLGTAASRGEALVAPKRQCTTDIMRSAESTNVSIINNEAVEEFKHRLKCSICLDVLENMTSTLCGHIFCATCIHQAIRVNGKCPLCQRRLHLKDTHRLYF